MSTYGTQLCGKSIAAVLLVACIASQNAMAFRPEVGKPLAGFTLPRIDNGDPVSLSDYRGKKLLLIMFASW